MCYFRLPSRFNEIFALLRCYAALIYSYRRFGTTYQSHLLKIKQPGNIVKREKSLLFVLQNMMDC